MKSAGHEMLGNTLILLRRNHLTFLGSTYFMCTEYLILKKNKRKVTDTGELITDPDKAFRFPLEVVIDHLSYRITAASMLPSGKDSHLYGSSDAGQIVLADKIIHSKMLEISNKLHLQPHLVCDKEVAMCRS